MTKADIYHKQLCEDIMYHGASTIGESVRPRYADGTPSHTFFVNQVFESYDLDKGESPILTLRPLPWKSAIKEILWIYQDQSNSLDLLEDKYNIHWWNEWDVGDRTIGKRYGYTIKRYDLLNKLLEGLKTQPYGRRHIINLYQYQDFNESKGLFPCAMETHWNVRNGKLDMTMIQRSSDVPVANGINKLQYMALMMMVARHCGFELGRFCHFVQNAHIYDRHLDAVKNIISREGQDEKELVRLVLDTDKKDFYSITIDDFKMENYKPVGDNPKFEMAI